MSEDFLLSQQQHPDSYRDYSTSVATLLSSSEALIELHVRQARGFNPVVLINT